MSEKNVGKSVNPSQLCSFKITNDGCKGSLATRLPALLANSGASEKASREYVAFRVSKKPQSKTNQQLVNCEWSKAHRF